MSMQNTESNRVVSRAPSVAPRRQAVSIEQLECRTLLTAGNILISGTAQGNAPTIYEYTQAGVLVRSIPVPNSPDRSTWGVKDVIVDPSSKINVFNAPDLGVYDGASWSFQFALNWQTFGVTYSGGLASYKNYIFAQSQENGPGNGIIRFDRTNNYANQIFRWKIPGGFGDDQYQPWDVSVGMDGKLYVACFGYHPGYILVVDPNSMDLLRTITVPQDSDSNCVADAQGNIYLVNRAGYLYKLAPDGTVLKSVVFNSGSDIDISDDGKLLLNAGSRAVVMDLNLNVLTTILTAGNSSGTPFVAWSTYQTPTDGTIVNTQITDRRLFYNNSSLDGFDSNATSADLNAIATDKTALLSGQTATFANYSTFDGGITGVLLDFTGTPSAAISAADFTLKVGNSSTPANWSNAPAPTVTVLPPAGAGTARIALTWANGAIRNQWLQVTVLANGHTGLAGNDVFYFGNSVGDTGAGSPGADAADYYAIRDHLRGYDNPAPANWIWDLNHDGRTDATDLLISRAASAGTSNPLVLMNAPAAILASPSTAKSARAIATKTAVVRVERKWSGISTGS